MTRLFAILAVAFVLFTAGQIDAGTTAAPWLALAAAGVIVLVLFVVVRRQARE